MTIQYKKNGRDTGSLKIVSFNITIGSDGARWIVNESSPKLVATNSGVLTLNIDITNKLNGKFTLAYGCVTRRTEWSEYPMLWKLI